MENFKTEMYERAIAREKAARKEAERILEDKSRELYFISEELKVSNRKLENLVKVATSELEGVFENIADAYVVMNLIGDVIKMNESAEALLGYKVENGVNLNDLVHSSHQKKARRGFITLFERGAITDFQINIVIAGGKTRIVSINASVVFNDKRQPIAAQGIVRDITDKIESEQRLIDSENRLSALISNLESGVLLEDENGNIVIANARFCDFFNITGGPGLLVGQNFAQVAIESKELFLNPKGFIERTNNLTKNKDLALSDELILNDGRILERDFIPIFEEGSYKGHLWTYRDVTVHRKYREGIEAERLKYSNIIANMNLGIVEVNIEDEIIMVNQSFEKISGYSEAELKGKVAKEVLLINKSQSKLSKINTNRLKGVSNSYEVEALTKGGELRHWLISGAPNLNINGQVVGSIGVHLDITKLKNLQIQKENLLKKLEKSNVELQEYAHVVSHDLKSPLRNINALVNWIKDDNHGVLTEQTLDHLTMIETTLEKMEYLISDVLEYSSVGSDNTVLEEINLNVMLKDIESLLHCPDHITLKFCPDLPVLKADGVRIQQLFQNLLSNAIRFSDKENGIVEVNYKQGKSYYTFSVKDNGIGIPKKYHKKIFKIFQSLNNHKESTGIGLSIVKKIVDMYGGKIWLESIVGEGTTFYFKLPKIT